MRRSRTAAVLRLIIGIALIPACIAAGKTLAWMGDMGYEVWAVLVGAATYVAVFVFFPQSVISAIFDREPVRRFWERLTGHTTDRERDRERDTAPPLWLVVMPYVIPTYTVAAALVIWVIKLLTGMSPGTFRLALGYFTGLTYAFHIFMVSKDIRSRHSDLRAVGYLFTLVLLFLINIQVLAAVAAVMLPGASWVDFNRRLLLEGRDAYTWMFRVVERYF